MELLRGENPGALSPHALLARDEALLDFCESSNHEGFVTFWESNAYFIVLGYGKNAAEEVFEVECAARAIPVLRRCSGGGTVLQGPGCFNYSLVLPLNAASELETISGANKYIMQKTRDALAPLASGQIEIRGYTDLTLDGRKFSGNAQRRKRRSLLFHGSFLLHFDLSLITHTLRLPGQQPEYRAHRSHENFLTNLPLDSKAIESALIATWNADRRASAPTERAVAEAAEQLVSTKYSRADWNFRL